VITPDTNAKCSAALILVLHRERPFTRHRRRGNLPALRLQSEKGFIRVAQKWSMKPKFAPGWQTEAQRLRLPGTWAYHE
jgi:hypothetical protein